MSLEKLSESEDLIILRLSEKKVVFKYKVPICLSNGFVISDIDVKVRYRIDDNFNIRLQNLIPTCPVSINHLPIGTEKLIRIISRKFGVKMCDIKLSSNFENHINKKFDVIKKIIINNKIWERDYKLKKITEDEVHSSK